MENLTEVLSLATRNVPRGYFHLNIDGGDSVYRERVYCYELYHQMRCIWPNDSEYCLNGELDKVAHPILKELKADHVKPDLLIHKPGCMESNFGIIEVKTKIAPNSGIKKDLETLSLFINKVCYKRAIYLFYGYGLTSEFLGKVTNVSEEVENLAKIEVWAHHTPGKAAKPIGEVGA